MDLIELKTAWNLLQHDIINTDKVDESEIVTSIHHRSCSEIAKIRSGLLLKFVIASISIVLTIVLAFSSIINPSLNPLVFIFSSIESAAFFGLMAVSLSVMAYFNLQAYSRIKVIQSSSYNLKDNLELFIDAMKRAISVNIFSDVLIAPIIITWIYYAYAFKNHDLGSDLRTAILVILPVCIGFISYYIEKFMQGLKFGKYLDRLSSYLESLQNNSSEV